MNIKQNTITSFIDTDRHLLTLLMQSGCLRDVVSVATTCKRLYKLAQDCSKGLFRMSLKERLCEPWIIQVVKDSFRVALHKDPNIPCPYTDRDQIDSWHMRREIPLASAVEDRQSLINLVDVTRFAGADLEISEELKLFDKFLKGDLDQMIEMDVEHLYVSFGLYSIPNAQCLNLSLLARFLELIVAKQDSASSCTMIVDIAKNMRKYVLNAEHRNVLDSIEEYDPSRRQTQFLKIFFVILFVITGYLLA